MEGKGGKHAPFELEHCPNINAENIFEKGNRQKVGCINRTFAGCVEISMEVVRLVPDVEPLPHEGLGPRKLQSWKKKNENDAQREEKKRAT
jgi:hypothetical protein